MNLNDLKNFFCLNENSFVPNVGIGTTSPAYALDVAGYGAFGNRFLMGVDGAYNAFIQARGTGTDAQRIAFGFNADPATGVIKSSTIATNGNSVLIATASGNVGIGTSSPTAKLHIGGTAGVDGIKFPDGTVQTTAAGAGGGAHPILRFTRTGVSYSASTTTKSAQCASEFGSNYAAASVLDLAANWVGGGYSGAQFVVAGNTSSQFYNNAGQITANGTGTSAVTCVNTDLASLRFSATGIASSDTDANKDSLCVSEFGSSFQAATVNDIAANWAGTIFSGSTFNVYGNSGASYYANSAVSGTVNIQGAGAGVQSQACIRK